MKAVILAAGKGVRMGELTKTLPKPLLTINRKTLLEYKLELLPKSIEEIIIVINYFGELIKEHIGSEYNGVKVRYVESELKGTCHALFSAKKYLVGDFLVMAGDDLYHKTDLQEIASTEGWALQVAPITEKTNGGRVYVEKGILRDIQEGSHSAGYIATSLYKLNHEIFNYPPISISDKEYGLPQTIASAKNHRNIKISVARVWRQVGEPKDLEVTEILLKNNPRLLQK